MSRISPTALALFALLAAFSGCGGETTEEGAAIEPSQPDASLGAIADAGAWADASALDRADRAQPMTCNNGYDCERLAALGGYDTVCCLNNVCMPDASVDCPSSAQQIRAANYDQSCSVDSDCTAVAEGNFCVPGYDSECPHAAINKNALPKYEADIANTPVTLCADPPRECGLLTSPCCRHGLCLANCEPSVSDTLAACTDAGGACGLDTPMDCLQYGGHTGPPDSCAYSDETCCLPP